MDGSGSRRVSYALPGGFDSRFPDSISTPVAQRQRHLPDVEASAGSSPAGGTAEWTGAWLPARSHKPFDAGSNPASATVLLSAFFAPLVKRRSYFDTNEAFRVHSWPGYFFLVCRFTALVNRISARRRKVGSPGGLRSGSHLYLDDRSRESSRVHQRAAAVALKGIDSLHALSARIPVHECCTKRTPSLQCWSKTPFAGQARRVS
jgi:hypothetical protein